MQFDEVFDDFFTNGEGAYVLCGGFETEAFNFAPNGCLKKSKISRSIQKKSRLIPGTL